MNSKSAKDLIIGKWGLKSGSSRPKRDPEKGKREKAALGEPGREEEKEEEVVKGKSKASGPERNRLLEVRWMRVLELASAISSLRPAACARCPSFLLKLPWRWCHCWFGFTYLFSAMTELIQVQPSGKAAEYKDLRPEVPVSPVRPVLTGPAVGP